MTVTRTDSTKKTTAPAATIPTAGSSTSGSDASTDKVTTTTSASNTTYSKAPAAHVAPTARVTGSSSAQGGHGDQTYTPDPAPDHPGTPGAGTSAASSGSSAGSADWKSGNWEQKYADLLHSDQAVATLRDANLDGATYQKYYDQLQAEMNGGPVAGGDQSVAPNTAAATSGGATLDGGATATSGWDSSQDARFRKLFAEMGTSKSEVDGAIATLSSKDKPISATQLDTVYDGLKKGLGDWNGDWKAKFQKAFDATNVPADTQAKYFASLSGGGNSKEKLQQLLDGMQPGWNLATRQKFGDMGLPDAIVKDLQSKNWTVAAYDAAAKGFEKQREAFITDGRMKKLEDAGANEEDKWGVIMGDLKGKQLDAAVDQIHQAHIPMWKRIGSMALNFIPGVGAIEYLAGKDFLTGEKIDRTNPLNIGMAVLSAIPVAGFARGGIAAIKGASMAVEGAQALSTVAKVGEVGYDATKAVEAGTALAKVGDLAAGAKSAAGVSAAVEDAAGGGGLISKLAALKDASGAGVSAESATAIARGGQDVGSISAKITRTADYYNSGNKGLDALRKARAFVPGLRNAGRGGEAFQVAKGLNDADKFASTLAKTIGKLDTNQVDNLAKVSLNGGKATITDSAKIAEDIAAVAATKDPAKIAELLDRLPKGAIDVTGDELRAVAKSGVADQHAIDVVTRAAKVQDAGFAQAVAEKGGLRVLSEADANVIKTTTGMDVETLSRVANQSDKLRRGEGVLAQSDGQAWRLNPLKSDAKVSVQEAGAQSKWYKRGPLNYVTRAGSTADADTIRLGRGVNTASNAGFAQTAGALDARALGNLGLQDARTAAIAGDGTGLTGLGRIRQAVLPGSRAEVQRAVDMQNHVGRGWDALRLGNRLLHGTGIPMMAGLGAAGVAGSIVSGQGATQYHSYQLRSDAADEAQAQWEAQQNAAKGLDPQGNPMVDSKTGLTIDPQSGLEYDKANGFAYDPATGTKYDLATGEVISGGTPTAGTDAGSTASADATSTDATTTDGQAPADGATAVNPAAATDSNTGSAADPGTAALADAAAQPAPTGEQGDASAQPVAAGEFE